VYFELKTGTISGRKTKLMFPVIYIFFLFQNFYLEKFLKIISGHLKLCCYKVTGHQKIRDFKGLTLGMDLGVVVRCGDYLAANHHSDQFFDFSNCHHFLIMINFKNLPWSEPFLWQRYRDSHYW